MKSNELMKIREMNDVELNKKLADLKEELFHLRFQHAINQPLVHITTHRNALGRGNIHSGKASLKYIHKDSSLTQ